MPVHINIGGIQKKTKSAFVNINNVWKKCTPWIKINDIWKKLSYSQTTLYTEAYASGTGTWNKTLFDLDLTTLKTSNTEQDILLGSFDESQTLAFTLGEPYNSFTEKDRNFNTIKTFATGNGCIGVFEKDGKKYAITPSDSQGAYSNGFMTIFEITNPTNKKTFPVAFADNITLARVKEIKLSPEKEYVYFKIISNQASQSYAYAIDIRSINSGVSNTNIKELFFGESRSLDIVIGQSSVYFGVIGYVPDGDGESHMAKSIMEYTFDLLTKIRSSSVGLVGTSEYFFHVDSSGNFYFQSYDTSKLTKYDNNFTFGLSTTINNQSGLFVGAEDSCYYLDMLRSLNQFDLKTNTLMKTTFNAVASTNSRLYKI